MSSRSRILSFALLCAVTVALCAALVFMFPSVAYAQEAPAPVVLSEDTVFTVSPTHVFYTCGNSLSCVDISYRNDPFTAENAFPGKALDVAAGSNVVTVLSEDGSSRKLTSYSYDPETGAIGARLDGPYLNEPSPEIPIDNINQAIAINYSADKFTLLVPFALYNTDDSYKFLVQGSLPYSDAQGYVTIQESESKEALYYVKTSSSESGSEGGLYRKYSGSAASDAPELVEKFDSPVRGITYTGSELLISSDTGVYSYDPVYYVLAKLRGVSYSSDICYGGEGYVYMFDKANLSIKRYSVNRDSLALVYNKCYDSERFEPPTQYDLLCGLRSSVSDTVVLYRSPRDLEIVSSSDTYVLALRLVSHTEGGETTDYYYCVTQSGKYGFAPASDSVILQAGKPEYSHAQPLHGRVKTPVYSYPLESSSVIAQLYTDENGTVIAEYPDGTTGTVTLAVTDDVARDNGIPVWKWYKVELRAGDSVIQGYADSDMLCPFTPYSPAGNNKYCRTDVKRAGEVINLYASPDENSQVLAQLGDNEELLLAVPFDKDSEWTCVVWNEGVGYILTENVVTGGLTTLQITLIVILSVLAALGIALTIVLIVKRKRKREENEEN